MTPTGLRATIRNILTIARREYVWRGRTRTFAISTIVLAVMATAVALAPVLLRVVNELGTADRIAVYAGDTKPSVDVATALEALLNANTSAAAGTTGGQSTSRPSFAVSTVTDLAAARANVESGELKALIRLSRAATGDLEFSLYSKLVPYERTAQIIQQASASIAITDRLSRAGIPPGDQSALFAPPTFDYESAAPTTATGGATTIEQLVGGSIVGFALTIAIFIAIMVYGQWVAMSVVEEKSSRVMEIVLGAARPIELMSGKVVGVGALGLTQYGIVFVPVALAMLLQDRIAALVLGGSASVDLPTGLSVPLLVAFGIFFVLGFLLYACLYAGVGSLVTRQEDVNQIVGPLTLVSTLGYIIASWASTGLLETGSNVIQILSFVPFLSPYLMLSRMAVGQVQLWEPVLAVLLLALTIVGSLWVAARLYAAGVLMYGQKPSLRTLVSAFRAP
jgi:ABC-2 type transport system permease protein